MTCKQKGNRESKGDVIGRKRHEKKDMRRYCKYALYTLGIYKKTWTQRKEKQKMREGPA